MPRHDLLPTSAWLWMCATISHALSSRLAISPGVEVASRLERVPCQHPAVDLPHSPLSPSASCMGRWTWTVMAAMAVPCGHWGRVPLLLSNHGCTQTTWIMGRRLLTNGHQVGGVVSSNGFCSTFGVETTWRRGRREKGNPKKETPLEAPRTAQSSPSRRLLLTPFLWPTEHPSVQT